MPGNQGSHRAATLGTVTCRPSHSRAKSSAEEGVFSSHMEVGMLSSRGDEVTPRLFCLMRL